ncbi:MAG: nitroreductase [Bacteroidetes bacterium HGW-Bacteroidetes-17]|jgi:nitroreductase|nr:MAG: nitroreductase [Bacteroidetes bacterium HGW-Bacteroidetes-17]
MLKDLIKKNRSYRRFYEEKSITKKALTSLVDLARLSPSGKNLQPLKYFLSNDKKTNGIIFSNVAWAGYLKDWDGPVSSERPSAYIILLGDTNLTTNFGHDPGIACQSILLGAVEMELGGCIIGSIKRVELHKKLNLSDHLEIVLIIALGYPKEKVVIEKLLSDDIKYWREESGVHHVPKRSLDDLII